MRKNIMTLMAAFTTATVILSGCAGSAQQKELKLEERELQELSLDQIGSVTLPELSTIEVVKTDYGAVTPADVEDYMAYIGTQNTENVDREAKDGDIVNIDFSGTIDGVAFDGGTGTNYDLELGSGQFLEDFEMGLIGTKAGDHVDIEVNFPSDYFSEEVAGKTAIFDTTVNAVKEVHGLTDEYIQSISTESENVNEYRDEAAKILDNYYRQQELYSTEHDAMEELVKAGTFEPSDALINYMVQKNINDICENIKANGMTVEEYLTNVGTTEEALIDSLKQDAKKNAPYEMIIRKVKEDAGITLNDDVVNQFMEIARSVYGNDYTKERLIAENDQAWFDNMAVEQAVYKYIADNVTKKDAVLEENWQVQPETEEGVSETEKTQAEETVSGNAEETNAEETVSDTAEETVTEEAAASEEEAEESVTETEEAMEEAAETEAAETEEDTAD